jgi:2-oxoglutarate dehydrogenase E1 component
MDKYSYVANAHISYIDELYESYKKDPQSVDNSWQKFFEGFDFSLQKYGEKNGKTNGQPVAVPVAGSL